MKDGIMELSYDQMLHRIQWVRDLVSGEYTQGCSSLKLFHADGTCSHCCLGVALEHIDPDSHLLMRESCGTTFSVGVNLTKDLLILGMHEDEQGPLMRMNDGGESFETIADEIAYATERRVQINDADGVGWRKLAPAGFARVWLEALDALAPTE